MSTRFFKPLAVAAIVLCAFAVRPAQAALISLDQATIDSFTQVASSEAGTTTSPIVKSTVSGNPWTKFTTNFDVAVSGSQSADVGVALGGVDWSAYDEFGLGIANVNENAWDFEIFVYDGVTLNSSGVVSLSPDFTFYSVTVDLTGLDKTNIEAVFVRVSGVVPLGDDNDDFTAEYRITAIPEPVSLLLMGLGLGLLGLVAGRRNRTEV